MTDLPLLLLTFFCGAAYELGCVFWVHYSETNRAGLAVFWSCFNALVTVIGLGEALHRPAFIAVYVGGYGVGTYVAIEAKRGRWSKRHCENSFSGCAPHWPSGCKCGCENCRKAR